MISPKIFKVDGETYRVIKKEPNQTKLKIGYAYTLSIYDAYVYPYRGEIDDLDEATLPGIYKIGKIFWPFRPKCDEDKFKYSIKRIITLTPDSIFSNLDDMYIDPLIEQEVTTDGDVFKPPIKSTDDIMLAGMKYAIGQKNINFNQYSHKFPDVATRNNSRRALVIGHSLRAEMASRFAEVFDLGFGIVFFDKPGCRNPMTQDNNTIYCIFNDDQIDFTDPKYEFKMIEKE